MIKNYPPKDDEESVVENEDRLQADDIIRKITSELAGNKSKRYCNYVNMGILAEKYSIDQTLATSNVLKELDEEKPEILKKVYNVKLISLLEKQETEWEVHAEYINDTLDPKKLKFGKMEKGNFKKFM